MPYGRFEGYLIEGHVPIADIRRLLDERPRRGWSGGAGHALGIARHRAGSEREAYNVILIRRDGSTEVFTNYAAA